MNVARRLVGGVVVFDLSGRMTGLDTPGVMKGQVTAALSAGHRHIVLNLRLLSFVDSSFIGELVSCCLATSRVGGMLKVACPVRRVQELFAIMHLRAIIESFDTEAAAIESFLKPGH
ncbi:MAG TPA: STAS domain-containing protein [Vicinamibacterales bacterium]|nr:STAS domain-containing protein [Vicinamibacterales bacterium]